MIRCLAVADLPVSAPEYDKTKQVRVREDMMYIIGHTMSVQDICLLDSELSTQLPYDKAVSQVWPQQRLG